MEGQQLTWLLAREREKKSQLQHLPWPPCSCCWLAPRYITLTATPRSNNIRFDTPPGGLTHCHHAPTPAFPCNHDHHDPRQKKKQKNKKSSGTFDAPAYRSPFQFILVQWMLSIIIIIRLNWIQDTICHRHTWFKRLVRTFHVHPAIPRQSSPSPPPSKGPDLSPLPPHSLIYVQSYSSPA
ncbi:hypothetical protein LZ32DRAFT_293420 [Colletotrichum eremochloae]|nr:hypothetical protein LZ32DRAFT_293420 [Colletotrichum eremochloae]